MPYMQIPNYFSTFPVKDKQPLVAWAEFSRRKHTYDERMEWDSLYHNYSWGIATGPVSRILVLDDDGSEALKKFKLPRTLTQKTPRGGRHHFFKWTSELDAKVTTKGDIFGEGQDHKNVDLRGQGGFVCFYGFEQPFSTVPMALPPRWLVDLLPDREKKQESVKTESSSWILDQLAAIEPGNGSRGRTPTFCRIIGRLKAQGMPAVEVEKFLKEDAERLNYNELASLVADQFRRYPVAQVKEEEASQSIEDFLKEQEKVEWIVDGMIAQRSIGFVVGLPETNKTWMMIDLAVEMAKGGGLWLGKFKTKGGKVLFVDQERFKGETQRRFKSVISAKNLSSTSLTGNLFIRCGTTTRLNLQNSFEAFKREVDEIRPDLIIIDSFTTIHTCEENNRQSIQGVLERVKELRNEFGCTILFIHHANKFAFNTEENEPSISLMAGSIAIPAASETVLMVRKQDAESSMVYTVKSTLASSPEPFLVKVTDQNQEKTSIKVEAF